MEPVFIGGLSDADLKFGIDINLQRNGYFALIIQDLSHLVAAGAQSV